jgi:putative transposase
MTRIALKSGSMVSINGMLMAFDRELGDESLVFTRLPTGIPWLVGEREDVRLPNWSNVEAALAIGEFKVLGNVENLPLVRKPYAAVEDALALDGNAAIRAHYVRQFDNAPVGLGKNSLKEFIERVSTVDEASKFDWVPSVSSVRRWIKDRGVIGDRRTIEMISMIGRTCKTYRFAPMVNRAILSCIGWYWTLKSRSIQDTYDRLRRMLRTLNYIRSRHNEARFAAPCCETIRRYIRRAENHELWVARYGAAAAHMRWGPIGEGLATTTILEIGILDSTVLDDILVFDTSRRLPMGRPVLVVTIDVFSRCILAWLLSFEPPQIWTVTKSIQIANRPKPWLAEKFPDAPASATIYGKFSEYVVDNAFENIGNSIKDGLQDLGVSITFAPIGTPEYKAIGERFFETLNTLLVHKLPGAVDVDIETRRLLHLDPQKDAILALEEVEALIEEAVNLYHYTKHEALNAQPARVWTQASANGVQVLNDDSLLTATLGTAALGSIDRRGLRYRHIWYRDPAAIRTILDNNFHKVPVRDRRKKSARVKVKFKYDASDLGCIQVFDPSTATYLPMLAVNQDYASGLSSYQHKLVLKLMAQENEEFYTEEQWLSALQRLRTNIEAAAPGLRARAQRAAMRLKQKPATTRIVDDTLGLGTTLDGQLDQFLIPNRPLVAGRTDGGAIAKSALARMPGKRRGRRTSPDHSSVEKVVAPQPSVFETDPDFLSSLEW